jgi:glycosyltransferase involved in cell wall biosynthesis
MTLANSADISSPVVVDAPASLIGIVVIGRNEGERLHRCLSSAISQATNVVYVDSGSTDQSVSMAKSLGVEVISLDMSVPFSAARARNAGFDRLMQIDPTIQFVQFVDGDCELIAGWTDLAEKMLLADSRLAVACGRRRERFPEQSVYNALCDMEWDVPPGETTWCGGDALMRTEAFTAVKGFDARLIAGEEPELCRRLRRAGWKILRLGSEMTLHDADLRRFNQWWRRSVRSGHAFAEGAGLDKNAADGYCVHEVRSIWLWGVILPAFALLFAFPTRGISLLLLLCFPLMSLRIALGKHRFCNSWKRSIQFGIFNMLGKFPQAWGQFLYLCSRRTGKPRSVIEYKGIS